MVTMVSEATKNRPFKKGTSRAFIVGCSVDIDKSAILGYKCESGQEVESETIGSRQLCAPLPSMRVPPCLRPHHCHTLPLYKHCALDLALVCLHSGCNLKCTSKESGQRAGKRGTHCNGRQDQQGDTLHWTPKRGTHCTGHQVQVQVLQ